VSFGASVNSSLRQTVSVALCVCHSAVILLWGIVDLVGPGTFLNSSFFGSPFAQSVVRLLLRADYVLLTVILAWFAWPVVLWRMNVRRWQLLLPIASGLVAFGTIVTLLFRLAAVSAQI
jgi:hypothetical protein